LVAKGTGRAVFNLTTVNDGCQDEAVVTQVADVAYRSTTDLTALKPDFRFTPESRLRADIAPCPVRADIVAKVFLVTRSPIDTSIVS
jgi:hypothetical protein